MTLDDRIAALEATLAELARRASVRERRAVPSFLVSARLPVFAPFALAVGRALT